MSPWCCGEGFADGRGGGGGEFADRGDVPLGVVGGDGEHAAVALDDIGIEQGGEFGGFGGGGHGQDAQFRAERALQVQREGESEIGFQGALVDFVEDDELDAGEAGVREEAAGEQALGDDFDDGVGRDGAFQAGAEADAGAGFLAQEGGHAHGGGAGGEAAGFEEEDFAGTGFAEGERDGGGFTGTGRGDEDGVSALATSRVLSNWGRAS